MTWSEPDLAAALELAGFLPDRYTRAYGREPQHFKHARTFEAAAGDLLAVLEPPPLALDTERLAYAINAHVGAAGRYDHRCSAGPGPTNQCELDIAARLALAARLREPS